MAKKKNSKIEDAEEISSRRGAEKDSGGEDEMLEGEETIDPSIIEDTFSEEFSEYNDVDNF